MTFDILSLPIELQDLIVSKMDIRSWMNYLIITDNVPKYYITKQEWDDAQSSISNSLT